MSAVVLRLLLPFGPLRLWLVVWPELPEWLSIGLLVRFLVVVLAVLLVPRLQFLRKLLTVITHKDLIVLTKFYRAVHLY